MKFVMNTCVHKRNRRSYAFSRECSCVLCVGGVDARCRAIARSPATIVAAVALALPHHTDTHTAIVSATASTTTATTASKRGLRRRNDFIGGRITCVNVRRARHHLRNAMAAFGCWPAIPWCDADDGGRTRSDRSVGYTAVGWVVNTKNTGCECVCMCVCILQKRIWFF